MNVSHGLCIKENASLLKLSIGLVANIKEYYILDIMRSDKSDDLKV